MAVQLASTCTNSTEGVHVMELRRARINEIKKEIEALSLELAQIKAKCQHERAHRIEDYAYCDICGEKLGWWGLFIS